MVVLGLILVALAVGAAAGVLMDNTAPASLEVFSRSVPGGLTTAEVFLTGVVVCAVFMFGFMLIASGIRRSRMRRRELLELRGEHDDTLDSLRYEKEQLERQLMQLRGGAPGPMPGDVRGGMGPGPMPGDVPGPNPHGPNPHGPNPRAAKPRGADVLDDPFARDSGSGGFWGEPPHGGPGGPEGPGGPGGPNGRGPRPGANGPMDTGIASDVRVAPNSRTYEELSPDADYHRY